MGTEQTYTQFSDELAKKWNLDATLHFARLPGRVALMFTNA
jgi:hypothetical protein